MSKPCQKGCLQQHTATGNNSIEHAQKQLHHFLGVSTVLVRRSNLPNQFVHTGTPTTSAHVLRLIVHPYGLLDVLAGRVATCQK